MQPLNDMTLYLALADNERESYLELWSPQGWMLFTYMHSAELMALRTFLHFLKTYARLLYKK